MIVFIYVEYLITACMQGNYFSIEFCNMMDLDFITAFIEDLDIFLSQDM
jgi:hypothetical protein